MPSAADQLFGTSARPGPGYFPFGLGILQALLGGVVLFKSLTIETEGGDPIGAVAWKPLLIIVGGHRGVWLPAAAPGHGADSARARLHGVTRGDEFHWKDA